MIQRCQVFSQNNLNHIFDKKKNTVISACESKHLSIYLVSVSAFNKFSQRITFCFSFVYYVMKKYRWIRVFLKIYIVDGKYLQSLLMFYGGTFFLKLHAYNHNTGLNGYPECNYRNQTKWWNSQCAVLRIPALLLASHIHIGITSLKRISPLFVLLNSFQIYQNFERTQIVMLVNKEILFLDSKAKESPTERDVLKALE